MVGEVKRRGRTDRRSLGLLYGLEPAQPITATWRADGSILIRCGAKEVHVTNPRAIEIVHRVLAAQGAIEKA